MKLAEALQERADLNTRIAQLRVRISNNALVQEGEKTPENPDDLIRQLNTALQQLTNLITRINLTNSVTMVNESSLTGEKTKSLTELIAERDMLKVKLEVFRDIVNTASATVYRARGTEIKVLPAVNVQKVQKEVDQISKQLRLVDNKIQETNWLTELK
ncbi:MAG: DIP1984 family protein [Solobacterium sp.]|nr:DIP1984 family protein [Solobacterium sp.]